MVEGLILKRGHIGVSGGNRDLLVNVEDALEQRLDNGVAESIDMV